MRGSLAVYFATSTAIMRMTLGDAGGPTMLAAAGIVAKVPHQGGGVTTLASGLAEPYGIAIDATNIYWTARGDGTIGTAPIAGGSATTLSTNHAEPGGIAVDETAIYWTNSVTGTVMKLAK